MKKYTLFSVLLVIGVVADIGTKTIAENRLASRSAAWEHYIELDELEEPTEESLSAFLAAEFTWSSAEEIDEICARTVLINESGEALQRGRPDLALSGGEILQVQHRQVTLIDGFLGFKYVENRGAAWGFLNGTDESFTQPFFIIVGVIAIIVIFFLFRTIGKDRIFLVTALSLIVGGAAGNIIDRARYGYVVDFVAWRPGFEWPTFNVADMLIVCGVAMMFIEVFRDHRREKKAAAAKADSAA